MLSLFKNAIAFVEPNVFDESSNLSSLSRIDLAYNQMTELEPWPAIRAQHRPMSVSLRHNHITNFTNALRWRYNYTSTKESTFDLHDNDMKHIIDIANGWNINGRLLILLLL